MNSPFPQPGATRAKICGITTHVQAQAIAEAGADAIGLNFWPKSKRYIAPAEAAQWAHDIAPQTPLIAVLVNPTSALLDEVLALEAISMLQLHGDESPTEVARVMALGRPVIKALQVRDRESLAPIGDYPCETILLDAYCPGLYGGEGKAFPWELFNEAKAMFPQKRFILAGGLTSDNVAEAIAQVQPAAVDVASGVESAPGVKDLTLVRRFLAAVR